MSNAPSKLSAVISVHNEENQLAECLKTLEFADEIVVLLDKCTDGSEAIAQVFTDRIVPGTWPKEGARRNAGIEACTGNWVFEIDAPPDGASDPERKSLTAAHGALGKSRWGAKGPAGK